MNVNASDYFYDSADGLRLYCSIYPAQRPGGLPVLCLPGLTRNSRDFAALAVRLSGGARGNDDGSARPRPLGLGSAYSDRTRRRASRQPEISASRCTLAVGLPSLGAPPRGS
jgi:hypothetical protein